MNETQPSPLTPPDCDLTDFAYMELDVRRLRDSKFASTPSGDAFRAGVLLWCAAWHQVPSASLPNDDVELASLAGYGRMPFSVKEWKKVRAEALSGFILCSDGRLYHSVIAEKAVSAFNAKQKHAYGKFLDRLRKENKARERDGKTLFGIPTMEQWNSGDYPHGIPPSDERFPPENASVSSGNDACTQRKRERIPDENDSKTSDFRRKTQTNPAENALIGNGTEQNIYSVPIGTGGAAAGKQPADMTKDELWRAGKSLLSQSGLPAAQCGSFVGKLVKDYGDEIVVDAVRSAVVARPADPVEYLKATCMRSAGQRASKPTGRHSGFEKLNYREGITEDGLIV